VKVSLAYFPASERRSIVYLPSPGSGAAGLSFASAFSVFGAFYLSLFVLLLYVIFKRSAEHDAEHTPGTAC